MIDTTGAGGSMTGVMGSGILAGTTGVAGFIWTGCCGTNVVQAYSANKAESKRSTRCITNIRKN